MSNEEIYFTRIKRAIDRHGGEFTGLLDNILRMIEREDMFWEVVLEQGDNDEVQDAFIEKYENRIWEGS